MIKEYLNKPYYSSAGKWKIIILASLFISLFMLIFQPFGLATYEYPYKILLLIGYGGVTFIVLVLNSIAIENLFKQRIEGWTILNQILWQTWIVMTIGIANYFYTAIFLPMEFNIISLIIFQLFTFLIAVIPVVTITLVEYTLKLKNNLENATEINDLLLAKQAPSSDGKIVSLIAKNDNNIVEVKLSDLLYIESSGNYIIIHYTEDNRTSKSVLRNTIKNTETQLKEYSSLIKCHRAFIININKVQSAEGDSMCLKLSLENSDAIIPVSRSHYKEIKDALSHIL